MKNLISFLYQRRNQTRETVFFKDKDHREKVVSLAHKQGVRIINKSKTTITYQLPPKKE